MILNRNFKDEHVIAFDAFLNEKECMVNATQMANVFDKLPKDYLKAEKTKEFIKALEEKYGKNNSEKDVRPFEKNEIYSDNILKVVKGGKNSGTWMHRYLALDFAMWLDAEFRLWVVETIEEILFGHSRATFKSISNTVKLQEEKKTIIEKKDKTVADFERYLKIEDELKTEKSSRSKATKEKFQEMKDMFQEQEDIFN